MLAIVGEWAATRTKEEIYHTLQGMRTIAGYVADVEDLLDSGQLRSREFFQTIEHPTRARQPTRASRSACKATAGATSAPRCWASTTPRFWASASASTNLRLRIWGVVEEDIPSP